MLLYACLCFLAPDVLRADRKNSKKLVISVMPGESPDSLLTRVIVIEIFRRADIGLRVVRHPISRSLMEADKGKIDGDGPRNPAVEKNYSNIIRLPQNFTKTILLRFPELPPV